MGLFSSKPGGTFVGNLLRGIGVSKAPVPPPAAGQSPTMLPSVTIGTQTAANHNLTSGILSNPMILIVGAVFLFILMKKK